MIFRRSPRMDSERIITTAGNSGAIRSSVSSSLSRYDGDCRFGPHETHDHYREHPNKGKQVE